MTKENFNNTLENTEKTSVTSNKLKALKSAILWTLLSIVPINAIAQNNTSTDTTKSKTEVVITTNEISPEKILEKKILEKHKITDIETATIEQLELIVTDLSLTLKTLVWKDNRAPYLALKSHIKDQIMIKIATQEADESHRKAVLSTEIVESLTWKKKE